jgi:hypothetical protein
MPRQTLDQMAHMTGSLYNCAKEAFAACLEGEQQVPEGWTEDSYSVKLVMDVWSAGVRHEPHCDGFQECPFHPMEWSDAMIANIRSLTEKGLLPHKPVLLTDHHL